MNNQNLVRLTTERAREIGRLGGQVKSPKKLWIQRLNGMKKKGLKDEIVAHLYSLMTEQESLTFYFLEQLEANKNSIPKAKYFELLAMYNKMQYGEKSSVKTQNTNLNINADLSIHEIVKKIKIQEEQDQAHSEL